MIFLDQGGRTPEEVTLAYGGVSYSVGRGSSKGQGSPPVQFNQISNSTAPFDVIKPGC